MSEIMPAKISCVPDVPLSIDIDTDWLKATAKGSLASVQRLIEANPGCGCVVTSLRPDRIEMLEIVWSAYVVAPAKVTVG